MSVEQEITDLIHEVGGMSETASVETVAMTVAAVKELLVATNDSLLALCERDESATSKEGIKAAFQHFNKVMRIFQEMAPNESLVLDAICKLKVSEYFRGLLVSATSLREAIITYKNGVLQDLASLLQDKKKRADIDDQLISKFLPGDGPSAAEGLGVSGVVGSSSLKRGFSTVVSTGEVTRIPKKRSTIPALATLQQFSGDNATKKSVLVTRAKIRAGQHDPKGLLDLMVTTTNALERTKKLELLKSSGLLNKSQNSKKSFSEKLNEATVRLDLGLGGHKVRESITFGAKVLSSPGFLSEKNILEVENNVVEGKTTWKHQDAYCKMVIEGCLNQAKRILHKYDEILYGSSPELLVETTHDEIRKLLLSKECRELLREVVDDDSASVGTPLIKKIVEAVAPIVPITLRKHSLDGTYLRQALHLLGAAEMLFVQYPSDVREHSNPAGFVGLATAMHSEFEGAIYYNNNELKSLSDFTKEMKSQYQTSLGLGTAFSKDAFPGTRRRRVGRGRNYWRGGRSFLRGVTRAQASGQTLGSNVFLGTGQQSLQGSATGRGSGVPIRGRGVCYGYQQGTCHRGASCRFIHVDQ